MPTSLDGAKAGFIDSRRIRLLVGRVCSVVVLLFLAEAPPALRADAARVSTVTPLPPVTDTDERAGACYSFYPDPETGVGRPFIAPAMNAGSRWERFDFTWPVIEPTQGAWNFEAHDTLVEDLRCEGLNNIVGILLFTPGWAAADATTGLTAASIAERPTGWYAPILRPAAAVRAANAWASPPRGLYLPWDDPANLWGQYVHTVVSRYGDEVKHWEMWNEPEWSFFWSGTSADYAQLLKVGYRATKAACPDCLVLFGGLHYWANPSYFRWVLSGINADGSAAAENYFFDVMSVHLYSRSSSTFDEVQTIREGMETYNVGDHAIWLTETGVPVWNDSVVDPSPTKYDYAATADEAAAYVIQSYANALVADVEKYFFFRVHDADMSEYFGLIRNDYSLRPSYVAYQVATTYLISPTMVARTAHGSGVAVTLWGTPRGKVSVLWNGAAEPTVHALPAVLDSATLVDRWGHTEQLVAANGLYSIGLSGATANTLGDASDFIIGGDPVLVVESEVLNEAPVSTMLSLPAVTYSSSFTVTWAGEDEESGVWHYDVQVQDGPNQEWSDWKTATIETSGQFVGEHDHTYGFRVRATDRVGNREEWPEAAQASTTVNIRRSLDLTIEQFFADENGNGVWDKPVSATNEVTLTEVALTFRDMEGTHVVPPYVGSSWSFTAEVEAGRSYALLAQTEGHLNGLWFTWPGGPEGITILVEELGLRPKKSCYFPAISRTS